jgi:hypothetical protein
MNFNDQSRYCHPEPIRFAQGKLREGSVRPSRQTLPLRFAQGDKLLPVLLVKNHYRPLRVAGVICGLVGER